MKISASELIEVPRTRVFQVFSDVPALAERIEGIRKVEILSETQRGKGLKWRETRVMFGKEATEEMEITDFVAPEFYVVEAESHGTHYTARYAFEDRENNATRVTWEFVGRPVNLVARLLSPLALLMKGPTEKALKKDVADLKRYLESQQNEGIGVTPNHSVA